MFVRVCTSLLFLMLLMDLSSVSVVGSGVDVDVFGVVERVVDGDTLDVAVLKVYDSRYGVFVGRVIRIRLADINAPELYTYEGRVAKEALHSLVHSKYVYLDIDDLYIFDKYRRVIAVLYLPINSTTLLNVNLWLVENGYAEFRDYPNEFNPYTWNLYTLFSIESIEKSYTQTPIPHYTETIIITFPTTKTITLTLPITVTFPTTVTITIHRTQQTVSIWLFIAIPIAIALGYLIGRTSRR